MRIRQKAYILFYQSALIAIARAKFGGDDNSNPGRCSAIRETLSAAALRLIEAIDLTCASAAIARRTRERKSARIDRVHQLETEISGRARYKGCSRRSRKSLHSRHRARQRSAQTRQARAAAQAQGGEAGEYEIENAPALASPAFRARRITYTPSDGTLSRCFT